MSDESMWWYGVRALFLTNRSEDSSAVRAYEERVVLIRALDHDDALEKGRAEADRYVEFLKEGGCSASFVGGLSTYEIHPDKLEERDEVWSCIRRLDTSDSDFVRRMTDGQMRTFATQDFVCPEGDTQSTKPVEPTGSD